MPSATLRRRGDGRQASTTPAAPQASGLQGPRGAQSAPSAVLPLLVQQGLLAALLVHALARDADAAASQAHAEADSDAASSAALKASVVHHLRVGHAAGGRAGLDGADASLAESAESHGEALDLDLDVALEARHDALFAATIAAAAGTPTGSFVCGQPIVSFLDKYRWSRMGSLLADEAPLKAVYVASSSRSGSVVSSMSGISSKSLSFGPKSVIFPADMAVRIAEPSKVSRALSYIKARPLRTIGVVGLIVIVALGAFFWDDVKDFFLRLMRKDGYPSSIESEADIADGLAFRNVGEACPAGLQFMRKGALIEGDTYMDVCYAPNRGFVAGLQVLESECLFGQQQLGLENSFVTFLFAQNTTLSTGEEVPLYMAFMQDDKDVYVVMSDPGKTWGRMAYVELVKKDVVDHTEELAKKAPIFILQRRSGDPSYTIRVTCAINCYTPSDKDANLAKGCPLPRDMWPREIVWRVFNTLPL